jgi:hypothetical protein
MIEGIPELQKEQLESSILGISDLQDYKDSSESEQDLENFKGNYLAFEINKYICPQTGAHFNFELACDVLDKMC